MVRRDRPKVNARQRRVGAELRELRWQAKYTIAQASNAIDVSASKISRMENGERGPQLDDVAALLGVYRAPKPIRDGIMKLLRAADRPGWLQEHDLPEDLTDLIGYEELSTDIHSYQVLNIPGLLQTEDYARQIISHFGVPLSQEQIEARVKARMGRKSILAKPEKPRLGFVIYEAALRQRIGGPSVMRAQLMHLGEMAARSWISLRVLPLTCGPHPGMDSPFVILTLASDLGLVLLENKVSDIYLEKKRHLDAYRLSFNQILTVAYGEERSVELIEQIAAELPEEGAER